MSSPAAGRSTGVHSGSLLLPEGSRLLHIGPHKTGSTTIQMALKAASAGLAAHGVHHATGRGHRPDKAGWALGLAGNPADRERPPPSRWDDFVRRTTRSGASRVCISNEDFGRATPAQVRRVVHDLDPGRLHVVAVVRRLDRYLPSQWQQRVRAGVATSFEEWLRLVLDRDQAEEDAWEKQEFWAREVVWERLNVWFAHDVARLVERWTVVVGRDRFTLLVADEQDHDALPRAFEDLLGLPRATLRPEPARSNRGLSWAETELVRALNSVVEERGWTREQRRRLVRHGVLHDMATRPRPAGAASPPFPVWARDRLEELSEARVRDVRRLGVRVIGDLDSLRWPADAAVDDGPGDAPPLDVEVAARAVAAVMQVALAAEAAGDTGAGGPPARPLL